MLPRSKSRNHRVSTSGCGHLYPPAKWIRISWRQCRRARSARLSAHGILFDTKDSSPRERIIFSCRQGKWFLAWRKHRTATCRESCPQYPLAGDAPSQARRDHELLAPTNYCHRGAIQAERNLRCGRSISWDHRLVPVCGKRSKTHLSCSKRQFPCRWETKKANGLQRGDELVD